jgi:FkbM family methyltransferase
LGYTERALLAWFRQNVKPGEIWLDVGAHYGFTAIALAGLVGGSGHVYAFEPSLTAAGHLNQTRTLNKLNQITVLPFGLGDIGEMRIVPVLVDRGMAAHAPSGRAEQIIVVGFDWIWPMLSSRRIDGVKVDVQGMELEVLEGMRATLAGQHPKLVIEFHSGVDRNRALQFLESLGYRIPGTAIEPTPTENEAAYYDDRSYTFEAKRS